MSRTHLKHVRAYFNGYDLSGYERTVSPMIWMYDVNPDTALSDGVKNVVLGHGNVQLDSFNGFLDNDAAGAFFAASAGLGTRVITIPIGRNAAPAAGDPVFSWKFEQVSFNNESGEGFLAANILFGGASFASNLGYSKPWGWCLHPRGAETGVNSAIGIDDIGASSAKGGIFIYHLFSSDGTVTLKAQHAATNSDGDFADLTGATSGSINASVTPQSGMISIATNETVNRYLRWQLALGTATTVNFFSAFIRNHI